MIEVPRLTAVQLAYAYRTGALTPVAAAEALLAHIGVHNGRLNALVACDEQAIRRDAAASTARWQAGAPASPLDGVPLVVKDSLNVAGLPTSWGSKAFAGFVPEVDELPVRRLRDAGMVVMGKANVPEFTLRGFTHNDLHGVTRNPWDAELTPGGSSGGAVAAVAAGFAPLALGADAGGSIRRPAGFTGLVGLKPSAGRVPRLDALPAVVAEYESVGPIARTVADAALCCSIIAAPDLRDRDSALFPAMAAVPGAATAQRILLIEQFRDSPVDHEVRDSVRLAADRLRALGHSVTVGTAPFDTRAFGKSFGVISRTGLAWMMRERAWKGLVTSEFADTIEAGYKVSGVEYAEALDVIRRLREELGAAFADLDLIMTPSSATLPWRAGERDHTTINGQPSEAGAHSVFTGFANISGYPGIGIPGPVGPTGLPIGFQLVARFGADDLLLAVAAQYEAAHAWSDRLPPFLRTPPRP